MKIPKFLLALVLSTAGSFAQLPPIEEDQGVTGMGLALRKLPTVGSVLYITAHPDDENNAVLAKLGRGYGYRTGLLTLTRGDGGQNEIGPELFEALGILRTEELMAIHRYDGAEQFFSRAYEFGYSYSAEETLEKWGREEILEDIVRVIRQFRPHVVLTLNPAGTGGGQHHQASAQLAADAFRMAGDPSSYPEQIQKGLRPWQPLRLYQSGGAGMSSRAESDSSPGEFVVVDTGVYDPLLGESFAELGARARSNHRSQGMNVLPNPGPARAAFRRADGAGGIPPGSDNFFDGINVSLEAIAAHDSTTAPLLARLQASVQKAVGAYDRTDFRSAAQAVMEGLEIVRKMQELTDHPDAEFLLRQKEEDFLKAAQHGHFIYFDALLSGTQDGTVVPGQEFEVEVRFLDRFSLPAEINNVQLQAPSGWEVTPVPVAEGAYVFPFKVRVPSAAQYSQPYWFRPDPEVDRFATREGFAGSEPVTPPPLVARVDYTSAGVRAWAEAPVQYRWFDAAWGGERRMEVKVVPQLSISVQPELRITRLRRPETEEFRVTVRNHTPGPAEAEVSLQAPEGWTVDSAARSLSFSYENEKAIVVYEVKPPANLAPGRYTIKAAARGAGKLFDAGLEIIDYHHIQTRHFLEPAEALVNAFEAELPPVKVGYVMGVGDEVARATEELGAEVVYLNEEDLTSGDLSEFDVIVTGVRAYLNREDLIANNRRLLDYVEAGGHLVVQYNKYEFNRTQYSPYPVEIDRPHDRVTAEDSSVILLSPEHPVFNWPNEISDEDWSGWVQERGLYFLGEWDDRYTPLLELQDPFPDNNEPKRGSLLVASYGEGTYIYTGLAFFRQLPAGVPGAYRLWANILSLGQR
ncbi:MAG: PIG-L family deacetylase [Acidobacteriota bacterium]